MDIKNRTEHIEALIQESSKRELLVARIQEMYESYKEEQLDSVFTDLIHALDTYCTPWVRKHLWSAGCYSDENEHTVLQDARMAIWMATLKVSNEGEIREKFAFYAFGIYKIKTLDLIRKISRKRKNVMLIALDEPVGDSEQTVMDSLEPKTEKYDPAEQKEVQKMYQGVFQIYCRCLLNSKTYPPRCLALYYARILPHLLGAIPDTKAASAKWAYEQMGDRTVWLLTRDSEKILKNDVDRTLSWGSDYIRQLDDEVCVDRENYRVKDIIYTAIYGKGKIEDWSDYMHKATMKAASSELVKDRELFELVKEYITSESILKRFLVQKEGRIR